MQRLNEAFDLRLPYSPSYTGLRLIIQGVDPKALEAAFRQHAASISTPPSTARRGLPHFAAAAERVSDIWPWLAFLGGVALLAEYLLFARFRRRAAARPVPIAARSQETRSGRPAEVRR